MANSPVVTSLPAYVNEQRLPLISKTILGAKTPNLITLETDVKSKTALNILSTDVQFGNGATCGWTEAGTSTLSQRYIEPAFLKINVGFCDKLLLNKWASFQVSLAAGKETLPFEENFVNDIIKNVNNKIEKMIWTGEKGDTSCDGLYTIIAKENSAIKVNVAAGASAYNTIKEVYNALPSDIVSADDTVIFVSEAVYREFIQELVAANLYHFDPNYQNGEYLLPGTSVRVISTIGLNDTAEKGGIDAIVAGRLSNFFYGCGTEEDKDTFDLWYSKDNREFRLAIEFAVGTQIAFPDQVVYTAKQV